MKSVLWFFQFGVIVIATTAEGGQIGQIEQSSVIENYRREIDKWLKEIDDYLSRFNSLFAHFAWELSKQPDEKTAEQSRLLGKARNRWKNKVCDSELKPEWLTDEQARQIYLLCRGPRFTEELSDMYLTVNSKMAEEYNEPICLASNAMLYFQEMMQNLNATATTESMKNCLHGEPDLERIMKRTDLTGDQLKWIWKLWHDFIGPRIKDAFRSSVFYQNIAAQSNGYRNMGEIWREELEIPNLEKTVFDLYDQIKPLYTALHAVVRHKLFLKYGLSEIDRKGPIPIHLLGNMWGQDWSPLIKLFVPHDQQVDLDGKMKKKSWNIPDMVREAEDFYVSLGFPKLPDKFWEMSIFVENENTSMCHGTAANMFVESDYRMLMCAQVTMEDFYVIHHEMGHIMYYMAYENQPMIFQDGVNSALHESIGDAIMHGVLTPQHLERLGLITDEELADPSVELYILFRQALARIPEIPFALLIDKYRWDIFKGKITFSEYNRKYWELNLKIRGIVPPESRSEEFFDAGAKFHVPDNTPYIRYFLSGILQMEIFKNMCDISLDVNPNAKGQKLTVPLHRCDIYGSKKSGKHLMYILEKGASIKWSEALALLTGKEYLSTTSLLEYYRPIYEWLQKYIELHNVYVGW